MKINLISDTVTKPDAGMLDYMLRAEVGDDVFKEDPTVNSLEEIVADLFGMEAGLFFPSGTMSNQTAINLLTQPGEQLICDHWAHVHNFEGGGIALHSGVTTCTVTGDRGMITAEQVEENIVTKAKFYSPYTSLVAVENTTNKGGGACYDLEELIRIKQVCDQHNLKFHLDGARIWNALIAKGQQPKEFGALFDTISVCFSKGLGAPVGSILLGDRATIDEAIRVRKRLGGGMRQVGYLANACLYALQHNVSRLSEDHHRAQELANLLAQLDWVESVEPTETNIVIFSPIAKLNEQVVIDFLKTQNIYISAMGNRKLRMVTHKDYTSEMHDITLSILGGISL